MAKRFGAEKEFWPVQEEVESVLGSGLEALFEGSETAQRVIAFAGSRGGFKLRDRALHVYAEAARVPQFRDVCNDASLAPAQKMAALGALMDASQASCRWGLESQGSETMGVDLLGFMAAGFVLDAPRGEM